MRRALAIGLLVLGLAAPAGPAGPAAAADCPAEPSMSRSLQQALYQAQQEMEKKKDAQAAQDLARYAAENPGHAHHQLSFMRGVLAYQAGDKKAAAEHFARAVPLWPCFVPALRNLALVRFEQKQPALAVDLALKAYHLAKPPRPGLLYEAAVFALSAGQTRRALPWLLELAARPQPQEQWLSALLRAHMELKQYPQAQAVLARLLAAHPGQERYWRLAASLASLQEHWPAAAAALEVAHRLQPPEAQGWRQLGDLYRAAGVPKQAARCYERAWGPQIKEPQQMDTMAQTYLQGSYPAEALAWAQRAAQAQPNAQRWALVGRLLLEAKRYLAAHEAFAQAAALGDPQGRRSLLAGYAAWQAERLDLAQAAFARALEKAPAKSATARDAARALKDLEAARRAARQAQAGG